MRAARILLIIAVIVGALFVAADRIALHFAESQAAGKAEQTLALTSKPDVTINGFPFLTQVLDKKLNDVQVTAKDIHTGAGGQALVIQSFSADLHGVLLSGNYSSVVADTATGTAGISYAELSKAAPTGVTVSYGGASADGKGQVKVTANVTMPLLGTVTRSVVSQIGVQSGNTLSLRAGSVPGVSSIPGLGALLSQKIDFSRQLVGLPAGLQLKSVATTPAGITLSLSGTNVVLAK
jgi:hypothetical protein